MRILLIEDNDSDFHLVDEVLGKSPVLSVTIERATTLAESLRKLTGTEYDLILLDLGLPDSWGLDTFHAVNKQAPQPPIIVLSGFDDEDMATQAVQLGAQDYLIKGQIYARSLIRSIRYAIERKKGEKLKQDLELKMLSQAKLASLGEMATGIAHEINQPLTFINSILQFSIENITNGRLNHGEIIEDFRKALGCVSRINQIVNHLRVFGRENPNSRNLSDITTILDNSLILMHERLRLKNIKLQREVDPGIPQILCNAFRLEQVLINLFQNAIHAIEERNQAVGTKRGGEIRVAIRRLTSSIRIEFADNGCGMSPETRAKMFEPFFTTKEVGKGTGLGLSIANGIIAEHNGDIACESEVGKGTTFIITLPAT